MPLPFVALSLADRGLMLLQALKDLCLASTEAQGIAAAAGGAPSEPKPRSQDMIELDCVREVKNQHFTVQQTLDKVARDLLHLAHQTATGVASLKKLSDGTVRLQMFTDLQQELEAFQNSVSRNISRTEVSLRESVSSSVQSMTSELSGLSTALNETVQSARADAVLAMASHAAHLNSSLAAMADAWSSAVAAASSDLKGAVEAVNSSVVSLWSVALPLELRAINASVAELTAAVNATAASAVTALREELALSHASLASRLLESGAALRAELDSRMETAMSFTIEASINASADLGQAVGRAEAVASERLNATRDELLSLLSELSLNSTDAFAAVSSNCTGIVKVRRIPFMQEY